MKWSPGDSDEKHLLGAVTQRHERARLHSLRRLVDHHHVELTRHAREHAAAGEGERGTHHSRFVEDGELDAIALQRAFKFLLRGSRPRVVLRRICNRAANFPSLSLVARPGNFRML